VADITRNGPTVSVVCPDHAVRLRSFPAAPDLPVVVAVRMSLSFPLLISAIPLFIVDRARRRDRWRVECVWFSDGGISSNFPMNFFDAFLPRRPTFGIDLQDAHPDWPNDVWKAHGVGDGIIPRVRTFSGMLGFGSAILDTMQNWSDRTQVSMPGFRDRVVVVYLKEGEGGMNLRMKSDIIEILSERGAKAARALDTFDFDAHRWVRYRVTMSELSSTLEGMLRSYERGGTQGYDQLIATYASDHYPPSEAGDPWRAGDRTATDQLMDVAQLWVNAGQPARKTTMPRPRPVIRVTPR